MTSNCNHGTRNHDNDAVEVIVEQRHHDVLVVAELHGNTANVEGKYGFRGSLQEHAGAIAASSAYRIAYTVQTGHTRQVRRFSCTLPSRGLDQFVLAHNRRCCRCNCLLPPPPPPFSCSAGVRRPHSCTHGLWLSKVAFCGCTHSILATSTPRILSRAF